MILDKMFINRKLENDFVKTKVWINLKLGNFQMPFKRFYRIVKYKK